MFSLRVNTTDPVPLVFPVNCPEEGTASLELFTTSVADPSLMEIVPEMSEDAGAVISKGDRV